MKFEELDEVRWKTIGPLLPPKAKEGKPSQAQNRKIINKRIISEVASKRNGCPLR